MSGEGSGSSGFSANAAEFSAATASSFPSGSGGAGLNPKGQGGPRKLMILKRDPRPSEPPGPPSDAAQAQPPLSTSPLSGMGGGYTESGGHGGRGGGGQGGKRFRGRGPPAKGPPSRGPPHASFSTDPSNH